MAKKFSKKPKPRRKIPLILVLFILAVVGVGGYYAYRLTRPDDTVRVRIGSEEFVLEVAATVDARTAGLSNRDALPAGHGMLFVYPQASDVNFWMKDTRMPMTAAYLDASGTILELHDMEPLSEDSYPSERPVNYVIELNQGAFARAGAAVGDTVTSVTGKEKYRLGF